MLDAYDIAVTPNAENVSGGRTAARHEVEARAQGGHSWTAI